jgi:hypothetical protein
VTFPDKNMFSGILVKWLCALALIGLGAARKTDISKFDKSKWHKPNFTSTSAVMQPFWDHPFCDDWEDMDTFPNPEDCKGFLICNEGLLWELFCEPGDLFDPVDLVCDAAWTVTCMGENGPRVPPPGGEDNNNNNCPPPGSNEVRFLPSEHCDSFYICINGNPVEIFCRPGQHWNVNEEHCDDPQNAGCDPDAGPPPPQPDQLPDCPVGFNGQLPHPSNCNLFIHCNNSNRSIQQCQHLHHFDMDQRRCIVKTQARCIHQARRN